MSADTRKGCIGVHSRAYPDEWVDSSVRLQARPRIDDSADGMVCIECDVAMEHVDAAEGIQGNRLDASVDIFRCPFCGEYDSQ